MSYDLYLWKWNLKRHVSPGTCFLLMADAVECEDAAILDGERLKAEILTALSARSSGEVGCEALPRGLILESHGMNPSELLDLTEEVARRSDLIVFDPQRNRVSEADRLASEALARSLKSQDEHVRLEAEMPDLVARAATGDGPALVELGNRSFFGEGLPVDVSRAFHLYMRAAEAGNEAGMVNVASCYRKGEGVARDLDKAVDWYVTAMKTDGTFAPFELGQMYEIGEGVAIDREKAIELFTTALEGDHPDARTALRRLGALPAAPDVLVRR